jgi:hypothetical protein
VVCLRPDGFGRVLCLLCSLLDCGRDYGLFDPFALCLACTFRCDSLVFGFIKFFDSSKKKCKCEIIFGKYCKLSTQSLKILFSKLW